MLDKVKINGTQLKLIAILTMFIDHIGATIIMQNRELFTEYNTLYHGLRDVGRLAFPIFCFLSVQGFMYTKDIKKYLIRLFLFAAISEIPFDLAFSNTIWNPESNNVIWSILFGIAMLAVQKKYERNRLITAGALIVACGLGIWLKTDYTYVAPLLMALLYKFRFDKRLQIASGLMVIFYFYMNHRVDRAMGALLSFVFIWLYDGTKGKGMKYFFYVFYPLHLMLLFLIRKVVFG